jgi:predicted metalloprotease
LERQFEPPRRTSPTVRARGRTGTTTIDAFLTDVLRDVDTHWTRVFAAGGLPEPRVSYNWIPPGSVTLYVVAHEYAHNLQQELGVFSNTVMPNARPFELQADCMAGVWAYSVFAKGDLEEGDIEEATNAALAVGDFDIGNEQHHGTPEERREALMAGLNSGDPSVCRRYLPLR